MAESNPFYAFIKLVELDNQIHALRTQSEKLQAQLKAGHERFQTQAQLVEKKEFELHELNKKLALRDLELKALQDRMKKLQDKLDAVASPKEHKALEHELELLSEKKQLEEEKVFELMQEAEDAHKQYAQHKEQGQLAHKQQQEEQQLAVARAAEIKEKIELLEKERSAALEGSPAEYRAKYESMRQSLSDPVVAVAGDSCGACASQIMPSDLAQLRRHVLVPCKECYRLLYQV